MKVRVNQDACIGCGACSSIASNVFKIDGQGLAQAIKANEEDSNAFVEVEASFEEDTRDAADGCPTSAIEIEDTKAEEK